MSAKNRYDAARASYTAGNELSEAEMWDIFEYLDQLEKALAQEGHTVEFAQDGFGLEHPVGCRKAGLLNCDVWQALDELPDTPVGYGRFPVALDTEGVLVFEVPHDVKTVGVQFTVEEKS